MRFVTNIIKSSKVTEVYTNIIGKRPITIIVYPAKSFLMMKMSLMNINMTITGFIDNPFVYMGNVFTEQNFV